MLQLFEHICRSDGIMTENRVLGDGEMNKAQGMDILDALAKNVTEGFRKTVGQSGSCIYHDL